MRISDVSCRSFCLALALVVGLTATARAGTVIGVKTVYFGENRPAETATIYVDRGRVRFDAIEAGRPTTLIFRLGDDGEPLCWVIDTKSQTYDEFTRQRAEKMEADVARARRQLEEQLESAPPEEREQMRRSMEAQGQSVSALIAKAEFEKVASGVKLGKWTCTQYEAYVRGEKQEDLWTAGEKAVGLGASDIEALREMSMFFSRFSAKTNAFFQIGRADDGGFDGFPVVVVEYQNGRQREKSEVVSVLHENLDPAVFELPPGARPKEGSDRP